MTRIRATCPGCGEVELRPADVILHLVRAESGEVSDGSHYRFSCPDCAQLVEKPADSRIAQLLTTGGVPVEEPPAPLVLPPHPEAPRGGPAFTADDVLDLHLQLGEPDWFDRFLTAGR